MPRSVPASGGGLLQATASAISAPSAALQASGAHRGRAAGWPSRRPVSATVRAIARLLAHRCSSRLPYPVGVAHGSWRRRALLQCLQVVAHRRGKSTVRNSRRLLLIGLLAGGLMHGVGV